MTIEVKLKMKKYNMILIGRLQKYQLYHQVNLVSISYWRRDITI